MFISGYARGWVKCVELATRMKKLNTKVEYRCLLYRCNHVIINKFNEEREDCQEERAWRGPTM
jgi:hypothetical protein